MESPHQLRQEIINYTLERTEAVVRRFLPGFHIPGYMAGYRSAPHDTADLLYILLGLRQLGIDQVCGEDSAEVSLRLLKTVDGPRTETFYSYRIAEVILSLGGMSALKGFTEAEVENLRKAVDSTHIYNRETAQIGKWAANYWAVLARCEFNRDKLGLLPTEADRAIFRAAVANTDRILRSNSLGYFDDSSDETGRYDIYSADVHLFIEPFYHLFDKALINRNLQQHVRLIEQLALENGATYGWGRSIGALSVCLTMELGALSLQHKIAANPDRTLRLIRHAFEKYKSLWMKDDLTAGHRHGMTDAYRGVHRLLQMTLDCNCKLAAVAHLLDGVETPAEDGVTPKEPLFPDIDTFIPFEENRFAGVWMFRNRHLTFQLPVVSGSNSDYAAWLHCPGVFENPVSSPMACGVPIIAQADGEFFSSGLPTTCSKIEKGIMLSFENWTRTIGKDRNADGTATPTPRGTRSVQLHVEGDTIVASENWIFEDPSSIQAIGFQIPESDRPLLLETEVHPSTQVTRRQSVVDVEGMAEWRSAWGPLQRVHQVDITPAKEIRFNWRLRPALRVSVVPAGHDYLSALYSAVAVGSPGALVIQEHNPFPPSDMRVTAVVGNADILHIGWPEHLFYPDGMPLPEFDARNLEFVKTLGRSPAKVVWTMHNRRPHAPIWREQRGDDLYHAWASVADAVIHHSHCGMQLMRNELPYKPGAIHVVIPHGHYGEQMAVTRTRADLEATLGIVPSGSSQLRFGVLGRAQKEKQVDMIVRAFMRAARTDQQLLVTAHPIETDTSADPRVILLPRDGWLTREIIAAQVHVCDALVSAHIGDTYLTSGTIADSIGAGIPMIANEWDFFREMLGHYALYHNNTEDGLTELFRTITLEDITRCKNATLALAPRFNWKGIAEQTIDVLRNLGALPKAS